ncbi:MAG: hypothetical protein AB1442_17460, partial [Nitrospirota bacterium]
GGGGAPGSGNGYTLKKRDPFEAQKRFRLTGMISFEYQDYTTETSYDGRSTELGWSIFEQTYRVGLQGYVYHPKLMVFSAYLAYEKQTSETKDVSGDGTATNVSYELSATFLQSRPVTLSVYATRMDTDLDSPDQSTFGMQSNFYGARLWYVTRKYPVVRLEYNHWDYTVDRVTGKRVIDHSCDYFDYYCDDYDDKPRYINIKERVKEKTTIDKYSLDVTGHLKFVRTRYSLSAFLSEFSNPQRSFTSKAFRLNTYTRIRDNLLTTYFQYSDLDSAKLLNFSTYLSLAPIKRLYHSYSYEYFSSETGDQKSNSHMMGGTWRYRVSSKIYGRALANYSLGERDGADEDAYRVNLSLHYGRPIKAFDFTSSYYFDVNREDRLGEFSSMHHGLNFRLETRRLRLAKLYSEYDFSYRTIEFDFQSDNIERTSGTSNDMENRFRVGATGKGPGRISWNVELEARWVDTDEENTTGAWRSMYFGESQWAGKIRHYTASGDVRIPLGRKASVTLRGSYTAGTTDSVDVRRYYYEGRLRYLIKRNMIFTAWLREDWRNKGWWVGTFDTGRITSDWRTRDYELTLTYSWRKMYFSIEYDVSQSYEDLAQTETRRLYLKVTRQFWL